MGHLECTLWVTLEVLWDYFEDTLGVTLGMNWCHFEGTVGSLWLYIWDYSEGSQGSLEGTLGVLQVAPLGHFWGALGLTLGLL